jgi:hypothetical protein
MPTDLDAQLDAIRQTIEVQNLALDRAFAQLAPCGDQPIAVPQDWVDSMERISSFTPHVTPGIRA